MLMAKFKKRNINITRSKVLIFAGLEYPSPIGTHIWESKLWSETYMVSTDSEKDALARRFHSVMIADKNACCLCLQRRGDLSNEKWYHWSSLSWAMLSRIMPTLTSMTVSPPRRSGTLSVLFITVSHVWHLVDRYSIYICWLTELN